MPKACFNSIKYDLNNISSLIKSNVSRFQFYQVRFKLSAEAAKKQAEASFNSIKYDLNIAAVFFCTPFVVSILSSTI